MLDIVAHLDRVNSAGSVESLCQLHLDAMVAFGFDRLLYSYTRYRNGRSVGVPQDLIVLTNLPPAHVRPYLGQGLYLQSSMIRWALENDGACSWAWLAEKARQGGLSPAELRVVEFNRNMGLTCGYTISFRSLMPRAKGGIGLCARSGLNQDDADAIWAEHGPRIVAINNVFHLKLLSLPHAGSPSGSERRCNGWATARRRRTSAC